MIRRPRAVIDVSALPDTVFGPRDIMWWGTVGFMLIEGFTLVLCIVVYVYLRQNFAAWPPEGTRAPSLLVPSIQLVIMLLSLPLVHWLNRSALAFDLRKVRIGLTAASVVGLVSFVMRVMGCLYSLNVKWDTNAYGSAQWLVLGSHSTLLLIEWVEITGIAAVFWLAPVERKHFSDVSDAVFYWWFMVLAYIPIFILCFLLPRWGGG
jgi:heme/copper-type cytochrome/quinol oxidase subunit 3